MGVISIREFNANVSRALARVTAGETLDITKNGLVIAEVRPKRDGKLDDPLFRAAYDRLMDSFATPVASLNGPASYEERTGR